jgi:hypothetical protein
VQQQHNTAATTARRFIFNTSCTRRACVFFVYTSSVIY